MTDWTVRKFDLQLSFLPEGEYEMHVWKDGINANSNAKDYKMEKLKVNRSTPLHIGLASSGGYVARLIKL